MLPHLPMHCCCVKCMWLTVILVGLDSVIIQLVRQESLPGTITNPPQGSITFVPAFVSILWWWSGVVGTYLSCWETGPHNELKPSLLECSVHLSCWDAGSLSSLLPILTSVRICLSSSCSTHDCWNHSLLWFHMFCVFVGLFLRTYIQWSSKLLKH